MHNGCSRPQGHIPRQRFHVYNANKFLNRSIYHTFDSHFSLQSPYSIKHEHEDGLYMMEKIVNLTTLSHRSIIYQSVCAARFMPSRPRYQYVERHNAAFTSKNPQNRIDYMTSACQRRSPHFETSIAPFCSNSGPCWVSTWMLWRTYVIGSHPIWQISDRCPPLATHLGPRRKLQKRYIYQINSMDISNTGQREGASPILYSMSAKLA